jgi:predicted nucleotidyltransferase
MTFEKMQQNLRNQGFSITRSKIRVGSDLDLGVLWENKRSAQVFAELYRDIQDLPTIRKIDLVDMGQVDEDFRDSALQHALFLDEVI